MSVLAHVVYLDYSVYFVYFTCCVYLYFSLQSEEELNLKDVSLFQVLQRHLLDLLLGLGVQSQHVPKHQSAMTTIDWEFRKAVPASGWLDVVNEVACQNKSSQKKS